MIQQVQYPDVVQPVLVPAAPSPLVWGWQPVYPDQFPPKVQLHHQEMFFVPVVVPVVIVAIGPPVGSHQIM